VTKKEALFWSIALPGFGQILNGQLIKGILFIFLEFLVNVQANFNQIIMASFQGNIEVAIEQTNFQWLMFYPCLYFFAMWDAFKEADGECEQYDFLPFVFSAYFVTVGTMLSTKLKIFGVLFGPVWLGILSVIPGLTVGFILRGIMKNKNRVAST
jgi:hypothetical protein